MSLVVADRIQEITNTTGTGAYTLGGAVAGFQTFATAVSDTDTVYYAISDNVDFEVGLGTYSSAGGTIARTTVFSSSNSDAAVDWGIGTKNIFLTQPASKAVYVGDAGLVPVPVGIDLNTTVANKPAYQEGRLFYDKAFGALAFYNDEADITLQIGQEEYIRVYNDSGSTISNGSPVYLSGESGSTPTIELATASGTYDEAQAVGIATHDIESMSTGYVTTRGLIADVDTSALTVGQSVHVSTTAGELQTISPTFPNFPTEVGICLISDGSSGRIYVNISHESFETMRVTGNSHMGGNLTVSGDFTVDGTQFINNSTNFSLAAPFTYLNAGADLTVTHSGSGLDDANMGGTFEGTASTTYYVRIDGTGTPDTFEWSKDNFATTEATGVAITTTAQDLDNGITVTFNATTGHTLNDSWSATAVPIDVDTGLFTSRNTGASGVGYTHMGIFFDASAGKWVLLNAYGPEPEGSIDLGDASVVYGTLKGLTWEGAVSGNATTATSLATGRTIGMTGDVVWTSASFDGLGNVTGTATIQPNSVALGTDTTGNYVGTGAVSGVGLSGSAASEGATFTVTSNATASAGNNTIVSRDGSGNFSAGAITADLTGDVTGNADTATALATGRTISLTGDVAGTSGSFDGSGNVSIAATIQANSVALGTDTTGNYVASVANGAYLTGGGASAENKAYTLGVDATAANTASKVVARDGSGNFAAGTITAALVGNASTATTLQTARTISGVSFDGSTNITLSASDVGALAAGDNISELTNDSGFTTNVGDITGVSAGTAMTGGGASGSVTLNVDVGTTANKVVRLDGSARLPAVDGSQLTGIEGVPSGIIGIWSGTVASIPSGWVICDGTNGTPNLADRFIMGGTSNGSTGGANSLALATGNLPSHTHSYSGTTSNTGEHSHTGNTSNTGAHSHTGNTSNTGNHRHSQTRYNVYNGLAPGSGQVWAGNAINANTGYAGSHSHSYTTSNTGDHSHSYTTSSTGNHSHTFSGDTGGTGSGTAFDNRPAYMILAYIMKT
jgi:hypothetical protein